MLFYYENYILNILLLNYEYPPLGGGAGIVTQHLANEFVSKGHYVTVLTTWFVGEPEYHSENKLTIIRLKSKRKHTFESNPTEMYSWMRYARKYCSEHKTDFNFDVCLANFTLPGGAVAAYLKKKWKLPFVILSHGHDIPWFSPKQMFFWHILCYPLIKHYMNLSSYNILLTSQLKQNADSFIGEINATKNIVIPNGLLSFNLRKGFNAADKVIQALFVGRLVEQKDPLTVVKSFQVLQNKGIPIHLKIIGDGNLKSEVEDYITKHHIKNIEVLGKISQSSVMEEYAKAHLVIAPSREEAMSLSVLEAISCGLYVFATDVSGNKEIILDDVNGNFVLYGNPENIAMKIEEFYYEKFLKNYQYPELMVKYMLQNYSWESTSEKYLTLFNQMLNTNSK